MKRPSPRALAAATATAAVALAGASCSAAEDTADDETPDRAAGEAGFAAGDYTAEGSYTTPGGEEHLEVDLTLTDDGTITAVAVRPKGVNPNSKKFQGLFASGIAEEVTGKNIATLKVDKVAGSSLSSGGFNAALDAIADQAKG